MLTHGGVERTDIRAWDIRRIAHKKLELAETARRLFARVELHARHAARQIAAADVLPADLQRLVVTPGVDERLSVELVIPLVRRVEPESLPGQFHGLVGRGVHAVRREFVVGRGVGRVVADRLEEQLPGAHRVSGDGILLDAFGVEPYAAQRIGVFGRRRGTLSRDERRGEEQKAEDRCRCEAFHGRQGV